MADVQKEGFATPSAWYHWFFPFLWRANVLLGGTQKVREVLAGDDLDIESTESIAPEATANLYGAETLLPKFPNEDEETYNWRTANAVLLPIFDDMSQGLAGQMFIDPPVADGPAVKQFGDDIDGEGRTLDEMSMEAAQSLVRLGAADVWIDYPDTSGIKNNKQAEARKPRPYARIAHPLNIIGATYTIDENKIRVLTSLRMREVVYEEDPNTFEQKRIEKIRIWRLKQGAAGKHVTLQINTREAGRNKSPWATGGEKKLMFTQSKPVDEIPFRRILADACGFMVSRLPLEGVIWQNITLLQSQVDQRHILHLCRYPNLTITGLSALLSKEKLKKLRGPSNILQATRAREQGLDSVKFDWIAAPTDSIELGFKDIETIIEHAQMIGIKIMVPQKGVTATAEFLDDAREVAPLFLMAHGVERLMVWMLNFMSRWANLEQSNKYDIKKRNTYIGDDDLRANVIEKGRARKDVPLDEWLEHVIESGFLRTRRSVPELIAAIKKERRQDEEFDSETEEEDGNTPPPEPEEEETEDDDE